MDSQVALARNSLATSSWACHPAPPMEEIMATALPLPSLPSATIESTMWRCAMKLTRITEGPSKIPAHENSAWNGPSSFPSASSTLAFSDRSTRSASSQGYATSATSRTCTSPPSSPASCAAAAPMPVAPPTTSTRLLSNPKNSLPMCRDLRVPAHAHCLLERPPHDEGLVLERQVLDHLGVREGVRHALRVREVGTEHEVVDGQAQVDQALGVGLVEDVDPHVAVEHLDGVLVEEHRALLVGPPALGVEGADPGAGELHGHELEPREAGGKPVADDRRHGVDEGVLLRGEGHEGRVGPPGVAVDAHLLVAEALPLVDVTVVAGVTRVHAHHDVEALHLLPERVELGQGEGLAPLPGRHRGHPQEEDLRPALVDVGQLLERPAGTGGQADDGGGVDGVGVDVAPVLVHPCVESVDHGDGRVGIVGQAL